MKQLTMLVIVVSVCSLEAIPLKAGPITERPADSAESVGDAPAGPASEPLRVIRPCGTFDCSRLPASVVKAMRNSPDSVAKIMRNMPGRMVKALERLM